MNRLILLVTIVLFAFVVGDNLMKEKDAKTFIKSRQRRSVASFEKMLVRECCDDPKCSFEERTETVKQKQKTHNDLLDVMCEVVHRRPNCRCDGRYGRSYYCKDYFKQDCRKRDCSCNVILNSRQWYVDKVLYDLPHMEKVQKSITVEITKNNNLHGQLTKNLKDTKTLEIEETTSVKRTAGREFETGFTFNIGGFEAGSKKIRSESRSFGEETSNTVTRKVEMNCNAAGGTFAVCETIITQLVVNINFTVSATNKDHKCTCNNTRGIFTSASGAEISQKTTTYNTTTVPKHYIRSQKSLKNTGKERHSGDKKYLSVLLPIFAVMLVLAIVVVVWYGKKQGYFSRSSYQEFDDQTCNDENTIDDVVGNPGDGNGLQLNGENSSWCLYQANPNGDSPTTIIVGSKDKIKTYAATTSSL